MNNMCRSNMCWLWGEYHLILYNPTFCQVDDAHSTHFCGFPVGKHISNLSKRKSRDLTIKKQVAAGDEDLLLDKSLPWYLHPLVLSRKLTETPALFVPLPATDWQKPPPYFSAQQPCLPPACHTGNKPQNKTGFYDTNCPNYTAHVLVFNEIRVLIT